MTLDSYKPYENWLGGNDLMALERAHARINFALRNFRISYRDRERLQEMLLAGSLLEYEQIRENWAELCSVSRPPLWKEMAR